MQIDGDRGRVVWVVVLGDEGRPHRRPNPLDPAAAGRGRDGVTVMALANDLERAARSGKRQGRRWQLAALVTEVCGLEPRRLGLLAGQRPPQERHRSIPDPLEVAALVTRLPSCRVRAASVTR
jgi:hypothetical protein